MIGFAQMCANALSVELFDDRGGGYGVESKTDEAFASGIIGPAQYGHAWQIDDPGEVAGAVKQGVGQRLFVVMDCGTCGFDLGTGVGLF